MERIFNGLVRVGSVSLVGGVVSMRVADLLAVQVELFVPPFDPLHVHVTEAHAAGNTTVSVAVPQVQRVLFPKSSAVDAYVVAAGPQVPSTGLLSVQVAVVPVLIPVQDHLY